MYTIETVISFEAAHRLYDVDTYSKECADSVHGHSYKVRVVACRRSQNDAGMVVDFKLFKKIIKEQIEQKYDHSIILRSCDPLVEAFAKVAPEQHINVVEGSPTAEWMAEEYFDVLENEFYRLDHEVKVVSVSVQETENNIATFSRKDD